MAVKTKGQLALEKVEQNLDKILVHVIKAIENMEKPEVNFQQIRQAEMINRLGSTAVKAEHVRIKAVELNDEF